MEGSKPRLGYTTAATPAVASRGQLWWRDSVVTVLCGDAPQREPSRNARRTGQPLFSETPNHTRGHTCLSRAVTGRVLSRKAGVLVLLTAMFLRISARAFDVGAISISETDG